jgi:alkanesulfonate monooxygenase SsuD/methylene tetrahydromethanopterin reductase-like flavin-dependent oxidoreductase (luciferase family)
MFREDAPSFAGRHYRIDGARNVPRPLQAGGPPIMIGGSGERRTLRLVAQYADMCNVSGSADTVRHKLAVLRGHCVDTGRDPGEITTTRLGTLVLTPDADETARVAEFLRGIAGDAFTEQFTVGQEAEVLDAVSAFVDAGVDELIFNMPLSDAVTVRRAGELLTGAFG